jgi:hypothetical protein
MKAQLLVESLFMFALAISFVVFVMFVLAGTYRGYQSSGAEIARIGTNMTQDIQEQVHVVS